MINPPRTQRLLYIALGLTLLVGLIVVNVLVMPTLNLNVPVFDGIIIVVLMTAIFQLGLRPLYHRMRQAWLELRLHRNLSDLGASLQIIQHELLTVETRRDLESLVSLEVPSGFGLTSAELTSDDNPNVRYALQLPLAVGDVALGNLFLGPKLNRRPFTGAERRLLTALQDQIALTLWRIEVDESIETTQELTQLRARFLANVTHELRTPLNGIINHIGFVVDGDYGPLSAEQTEYIYQALDNAEHLLNVINNFLDLSKLETGQLHLQMGEVNLSELVHDVERRIGDMLGERTTIQFQAYLADNIPHIAGDYVRLRQVLLNLLAHSLKFTDSGLLTLRVTSHGSTVLVQIADTGVGIDSQLLPDIFVALGQSNDPSDTGRQGPGLSLPIAKALIELHGGHIGVQSQIGAGTVFTITLPAHKNFLRPNNNGD